MELSAAIKDDKVAAFKTWLGGTGRIGYALKMQPQGAGSAAGGAGAVPACSAVLKAQNEIQV